MGDIPGELKQFEGRDVAPEPLLRAVGRHDPGPRQVCAWLVALGLPVPIEPLPFQRELTAALGDAPLSEDLALVWSEVAHGDRDERRFDVALGDPTVAERLQVRAELRFADEPDTWMSALAFGAAVVLSAVRHHPDRLMGDLNHRTLWAAVSGSEWMEVGELVAPSFPGRGPPPDEATELPSSAETGVGPKADVDEVLRQIARLRVAGAATEAEALAMALLEHHQRDARSWVALGLCSLVAGAPADASDACAAALRCDPDSAVALALQAVLQGGTPVIPLDAAMWPELAA
jgi:hypothetical protein